MPQETQLESPRLNGLERMLKLFADVRGGEGVTAVLMFLNIFLVLTAYYVLKVVREQLTIGGVEIFGLQGDEIKAYLPAVMAVLLLGIVPLYGYVASIVDRLTLIKRTLTVVMAGLVLFFLWGQAAGIGTAIGLSFYVFLGIVNVFLIAQFWSYANDIYTESQGKRLFAIIAIGQSLGAVLGPRIAAMGAEAWSVLLVVSAGIFALCLGLYVVVNRRLAGPTQESGTQNSSTEKPLEKSGGFQLVFKTQYLLLVALMILVTNVINTTGEYILSNTAKTQSEEQVPVSAVVQDLYKRYKQEPSEVRDPWRAWFDARSASEIRATIEGNAIRLPDELEQEVKEARGPVIGRFYGDFFFYVNLAGLLIQMFLVSRILKYFGVRPALFVLPVIAFGGYAAIGLLGGVLLIKIAKTAENSTDYSLQNTVKQALFLPTSREAKYKAKAAIDTFFVRFGDAASAAIVAVGLHALAFTATTFAFVNVGLCALWVLLNVGISREHRRLHADLPAEEPSS